MFNALTPYELWLYPTCHTTQHSERIITHYCGSSKRPVQRIQTVGHGNWEMLSGTDDPAASRLGHPRRFDDVEKPEAEDEGLEKGRYTKLC